MEAPVFRVHVPVLYDGAWECSCGFTTQDDAAAWRHYGRRADDDLAATMRGVAS